MGGRDAFAGRAAAAFAAVGGGDAAASAACAAVACAVAAVACAAVASGRECIQLRAAFSTQRRATIAVADTTQHFLHASSVHIFPDSKALLHSKLRCICPAKLQHKTQ